jgi:Tfp pilus assembly protein PilN
LFVNFFAKSPTLQIVVFAKSFNFYFFLWLFQAYTTELEQKVELLQEENARLKRQQKEVNT